MWALLSRRYFALFSYSTHFTRSQQLSPQEEKTFDVKLNVSVSGNFQEVIFRGNPQEEPFALQFLVDVSVAGVWEESPFLVDMTTCHAILEIDMALYDNYESYDNYDNYDN